MTGVNCWWWALWTMATAQLSCPHEDWICFALASLCLLLMGLSSWENSGLEPAHGHPFSDISSYSSSQRLPWAVILRTSTHITATIISLGSGTGLSQRRSRGRLQHLRGWHSQGMSWAFPSAKPGSDWPSVEAVKEGRRGKGQEEN